MRNQSLDYELLVQHKSVPVGEPAAPIENQYSKSVGCSLSNLVYATSPGKSLIKGGI
jgi:hypothetical protein